MLTRMWRKRDTPPLLVGLQAGTTTLEISLAVPQEIGHSTTGGSSNTSPGHILSILRKNITRNLFFAVTSENFFFIRYFLYLHYKCYPESSLYPPPALLPYPLTPTSGPWCSPVLGHIKFAWPIGLSFQWWLTRPSFDTYAARVKSSGVLVSS